MHQAVRLRVVGGATRGWVGVQYSRNQNKTSPYIYPHIPDLLSVLPGPLLVHVPWRAFYWAVRPNEPVPDGVVLLLCAYMSIPGAITIRTALLPPGREDLGPLS